MIDPQDATYVLRGQPYCFLTCLRRAEAAEDRKVAQRRDLVRREQAARMAGGFDVCL